MQKVQSICNRQMEFFPRVMALCVYDSTCASLAAASSVFWSSGKKESRRMLGRFEVSRKGGGGGGPTRGVAGRPKVYAKDVTSLPSLQ